MFCQNFRVGELVSENPAAVAKLTLAISSTENYGLVAIVSSGKPVGCSFEFICLVNPAFNRNGPR
jgi:hypothetical protein